MRIMLNIAFIMAAAVFGLLGLYAITPIDQVVDAATSLSQDRIFKGMVLFLLAAIAVKP